jgi:hypothetical protein
MDMGPSRHHFDLKGKTAETFVHELALKTFLTDWCFPNPVLPNGKELCDLLVVFDNVAIIWQIKDVKLGRDGRYNRSEVEKNLRQLSGARRQLFELQTSIRLQNSRRTVETFDPIQISEVFLISVLLGEGEDFFPFIEPIREFTAHVFTRDFVQIILTELDTIADFTKYLRAKEALIEDDKSIGVMGGEEELLAVYLTNDRGFGEIENARDILIEEGAWEALQESACYRSKKREDKISYEWDGIINTAHEGSKKYELITRELARPNRFERRVLANTFLDAWLTAHRDEAHDLSRTALEARDATYCFLFCEKHIPLEDRKNMLKELCYVARGNFLDKQKVIGIATEKRRRASCSFDFCLINLPIWTSENQREMEKLQRRNGIFLNPKVGKIEETEYPECI